MNVIFLDIDGVMNSIYFYEQKFKKLQYNPIYQFKKLKNKLGLFKYRKTEKVVKKYIKISFENKFKIFKKDTDPIKRTWLCTFCNHTNTKIVISSTWRRYFTIEEWDKVFNRFGANENTVIGITSTRQSIRGEEIKTWLDEHPEVKNYAILDDDSDMLPEQLSHFFLIDGYYGVSPTAFYKINILFNNLKKRQ